jgi:hypothetical protein
MYCTVKISEAGDVNVTRVLAVILKNIFLQETGCATGYQGTVGAQEYD